MEPLSAFERLVLVLAAAVSFWLFWRRLARVLALIWKARKDADFTFGAWAGRLQDFFWEVVLQAKVIRHRPLAGLAHAFVFWGFCAFALVTLNHFSMGFGAELLSRDGPFGRFYFALAALFALAVAVSIIGLAARRFIAQPRWLGAVSVESGVIAFLIFTLMWTYLADYATESRGGAGKLVWWIHTAAILVFLPIIPRTKHLHLMFAPVAILFKRDGFSRIPPLAGDEDFGLETGKDVTRLLALQAFSCVECGRCSEHCPAYNTEKILNPKEIILGVRGYLDEFGPQSEQPLLGKHLSQTAVFQCTTCGACEFQCPVGVQHLPAIIGLRRGAVNTGKWEDTYGNKLFLNLERNGNPLGFSSIERDKFIAKLGLPFFDGSQDYCLWLGCMGAYDPEGREIIAALIQVLDFLGIKYGVLRRERCSGDAARRLGNDLAFAQLAEQNLQTLRSSKVSRLLSICPHCVRTIGEDYKEFGDVPAVEHHSQLLARHYDRLPKNAQDRRVVFHDPCYLGRYRGVYEAPRRAASVGGLVTDPPRARERSFCCGAGGGLAFLGEEEGQRVNVTRARELVSTKAELVAAACPFCNTMFRDALPAVSQTPPVLVDIAQIAADAIRARQASGS